MEDMTPQKTIYLSKRPANFQVYPSEIKNHVFSVVVQVLDRSRSIFNKIFPKKIIDDSGIYRVALFLDFKWQEIEIDDQLPLIGEYALSTWCNT